MARKKKKSRADKATLDRAYLKAKSLIQQGLTTKEACKKAGIGQSVYHYRQGKDATGVQSDPGLVAGSSMDPERRRLMLIIKLQQQTIAQLQAALLED